MTTNMLPVQRSIRMEHMTLSVRGVFDWACVPVYVLADFIGALLQFQRRRADLRQGCRVELRKLNQFQGFWILCFTAPTNADVTHPARIILLLEHARLVPIELIHD